MYSTIGDRIVFNLVKLDNVFGILCFQILDNRKRVKQDMLNEIRDVYIYNMYDDRNFSADSHIQLNYVNNKRHGLHECWHFIEYEDDSVEYLLYDKCNYIDGKLHGSYRVYGHGQFICQCNYVDGKLHGLFERWHYQNIDEETNLYTAHIKFKKSFTQLKVKYKIQTTRIREKSNYINGKLHGLRQFWHGNGKIWRRGNYNINGKKHGLFERWYYSGKLMKTGNYINGKKHGIFKHWSNNGQLISI